MKAAIYDTFQGAIRVEDVDVPEPKPHGVVIRVRATGICRSDWHGWMGHDPDIRLPHVPGHELAGEIVDIGNEVSDFKPGNRVTVPFVCGCGTCRECRSGNQQVCDHQSQPGFTHWGSFAEYVTIDYADTNLVQLPDEISFKTAAILGCRFITSYRAVVDQGQLQEGQYIAIHGCGGVGLSAIMIAHAIGAQIIAIDINKTALALAQELGATMTIDASQQTDVVATVKDLTDGGAHLSIDALGSAQTCYNSISNLRKRGRHIQVGLMTEDHEHTPLPIAQVIAEELEIIGSHGMQAHRYPEMLELILSGRLQPEQLIKQTISLEEGALALTQMDTFTTSGVLVIDTF